MTFPHRKNFNEKQCILLKSNFEKAFFFLKDVWEHAAMFLTIANMVYIFPV